MMLYPRFPLGKTAPTASAIVGRWPHESAELYAVTDSGVERLRSHRRHGSAVADWRGRHAAVMEFSHSVLVRVVGKVPSPQLCALFAADVALTLPEDGFVIEARNIRRWADALGDERDWSPLVHDGDAPRKGRWSLFGSLGSLGRLGGST